VTEVERRSRRRLGDFVGSTIRGLEYFGAVPRMLVVKGRSGDGPTEPFFDATIFGASALLTDKPSDLPAAMLSLKTVGRWLSILAAGGGRISPPHYLNELRQPDWNTIPNHGRHPMAKKSASQ